MRNICMILMYMSHWKIERGFFLTVVVDLPTGLHPSRIPNETPCEKTCENGGSNFCYIGMLYRDGFGIVANSLIGKVEKA